MTTTTDTTTAPAFKAGDRVTIARDNTWHGLKDGTVQKVSTDDSGTRYGVLLDADERDYEEFSAGEVEEFSGTSLDDDNIASIRGELVSSVANASDNHGLNADDVLERIRAASRISHLASRLASLEACDAKTSQRLNVRS